MAAIDILSDAAEKANQDPYSLPLDKINVANPFLFARDIHGAWFKRLRDEARHVTFGINYLEEHLKNLSEAEREERARFAYEACVVARERMIPKDVFHHWGWNVEEARRIYLDGEFRQMFRNLMFMRVMPNLRRIGLLTDSVRPLFEQLGMLEYENLKDDGDIDWAELSRPLFGAAN